MSAPKLPNIVVEKDVSVPTRDSVQLTTDIYRQDDGKKHPVLIVKSPYDKDDWGMIHNFVCSPYVAAEHGYAAIVQHARGRFKSEGSWDSGVHDGQDTYDTIEWAAAQPWSDGNVGMYGWCGVGYSPFRAAVEQAPHLKAIFSYVSAANWRDGWFYRKGGALELWFTHFWADFLNADPYHHIEPTSGASTSTSSEDALALSRGGGPDLKPYEFLPVKDIPQVADVPCWQEWVSHPSYDEYWQQIDAVAQADRITVPVLDAGGWYDQCLGDLVNLGRAISERGGEHAREHSRLLIGPWDHSAYYNGLSTYAGERNFGTPTGPVALAPILFRWFDHWLKGKEATFLPGENKVQYFQMGENVWKEAPSWPPAHTKVPYFLHSRGRANSRLGDGALSPAAADVEPADSFVYDPRNPVLGNGGQTMAPPQGVQNQATNELREDVLVYSTPRLADPVAIAGPVTVTLFASSSAEDTDFVARLVDVEPDGYCANITEGILRARYRNDETSEEFLTPGEVTRFDIELYDTAHTFLPDHAIRLEITSSCFPRYDRNLNSRVAPALGTEADVQKAVQQVFHDQQFRSNIVLPVV
jgi:putative CocE/NonD family hydrolase